MKPLEEAEISRISYLQSVHRIQQFSRLEIQSTMLKKN